MPGTTSASSFPPAGAGPLVDAALLLQRAVAGGFLLPHGLAKLLGWFGGPGITGFAAELQTFGFPSSAPIPFLLAALQTLLGVLVLLGAWTRLSAVLAVLFIAVTVLVAVPNGWFWNHHGIEYPLFWTAILLSLVLTGGGRWSLDRLMRRHRVVVYEDD